MTSDGGTVNRTDPAEVTDQADRVLVSFRSPEADPDGTKGWWIADSDWLEANMNESTYRRYLQRAHAGPVDVGDEWDEFVNCGCASPEDVTLRVERIEGGSAIGTETTIDVASRKTVLASGDAGQAQG